jgi:hypothetical protein
VALSTGDSDGVGWAELRLGHNCWKHDEDLTIRYAGVRTVTTNPTDAAAHPTELVSVVIDELLPHEHGCSHQVAFLTGSATITCADLSATWHEAGCYQR